MTKIKKIAAWTVIAVFVLIIALVIASSIINHQYAPVAIIGALLFVGAIGWAVGTIINDS